MQIQALLLLVSLVAAMPQVRPKAIATSAAKTRPKAITTTPPAARVRPSSTTAPTSTTASAAIQNAGNVAAPAQNSAAPMNQLSLPFTNQASFVQAMLESHNTYRQRHGVANLTWNTDLVKGAVAQLAKQTFEHTANNPYGENIASYYRNDFNYPAVNNQNPRQQVQWWYDEVSIYNYSRPGYSKSTGHFTQIVWNDTKELGCAWDQLNGTDGGYTRRLTCEYLPKGNWLNSFAQNVLLPVGPAPASQPEFI